MVQAPVRSKGFRPSSAEGVGESSALSVRAALNYMMTAIHGTTAYKTVERESRGIGEGRSRGSGVAAASEERWTISPHRTHGADFFVRTLRSSDDF